MSPALIVSPDATARTAQLAEALRSGGHEPALIRPDHPLPEAAIVIWAAPLLREQPFRQGSVHAVDLTGPPQAGSSPARLSAWRTETAIACRGAALALAGSEAEQGQWTAELDRLGIATPVLAVPFATPGTPGVVAPGAFTVVLEQVPGPAVLALVHQVASTLAQRPGAVLSILAGPPGGLPGLVASRALAGLPGEVRVIEDRPGAPLPPGILLDIRADTGAERVYAVPAVTRALAQGLPVLSTVLGPLTQKIAAAGAGFALRDVAAGLAQMSALTPTALAAMGKAATTLARDTVAQAARALLDALHLAAAVQQTGDAAWRDQAGTAPLPLGPGAHVLVVSNEGDNLIDIRIHLVFGAMHRRGAIGGYSVLRFGRMAFSTRTSDPEREPRFDAIWVHRAHDPAIQLMLRVLKRPYAYDMDDNLLASPSYREAFRRRAIETVRAMVRDCAVLSCSTATLVSLLQRHSEVRLADKAVVTPNLAVRQPAPREAGPPRAVVWASSDTPALTETREAVERAVGDFCRAHRLRLVCLGAPPPALLAASGIEIQHVGMLPYGAYLEFLRALSPAILVCPLETVAEPMTQDFVDGKSDVKMLEAACTGLVGVFSRAAPYRDSGLGPAILCDNTHKGWLDGLERAARACREATPAAFPPGRVTTEDGLAPWGAALARAALPLPVYLSEIEAALDYVEERRKRFLEPGEFDEAYYLETHDDVRAALERGELVQAYDHYKKAGYGEGRDARALENGDEGGAAWWATLLYTIGRLEDRTAARAQEIELLQAARDARQALTRP